ncbi:MAG: helix-turn-helix domain-containing protein [Victivallaceae bacterium]|nr:helix-turn-helix domain-containing protein [Victivallaceae bacterium]
MIKVLDKAFGILEMIARKSPQPVALGNIAMQLQLNKATCSRIISELIATGYLVRVSRLEGYTIGPRAFALKQSISYKTAMLKVAEPIIRDCALEIGQSVLMAELCNGRRYILAHHSFNPRVNIELNQLDYDDVYEAATGITLLANMPPADLNDFIRTYGLPDVWLWDSDSREEAIKKFLKSVRQQQRVVYTDAKTKAFSIAAFPVFRNGECIAALGLSVPHVEFTGDYKLKVIKKVAEAANEISLSLSTYHTMG